VAEACDYIILGDSHTKALKEGFDANGLRAEVLTFSGNLWHAGHIVPDERHGISSGMALVRQLVAAMEDRIGATMLTAGVPVIASVGYHLGRLAPPYSFRGHVANRADFTADEQSLFTSQGFLRAYVRHHRHFLVKLLRRLNRAAPVLVVAPPDVRAAPNYAVMRTMITELIRESSIAVHDPGETGRFAAMRPLGEDYLAEDRVHGNARYGAELVAELLARGAIPQAAAAE
jgi:hypothetical protein